jgi:hypothetical protein
VSRGPGEIMKTVLLAVCTAEEHLGGLPSYHTLAAGVYQTETPSRAQLSAVARAARRLEEDGFVEIYAWEDDLRRKFVGTSPWLYLACLLLHEAELGEMELDLETGSNFVTIKRAIELLQHMVEDGLIVCRAGEEPVVPGLRRLTVRGPVGRLTNKCDSD